jgi:hypothetical protein
MSNRDKEFFEMKFKTQAQLERIRKEHHKRIVWIAVAFVSFGAVLFALEILALAGMITVLGVILQGLSDPE